MQAIGGAERTQNQMYQAMAESPSQIAPAAPGKPTTASVCPANVSRRNTMNQPTTAATTATIVPARSALSMKWNASALRTSSTRFGVSRTVASMSMAVPVVVVHLGAVRRRFGVTDDDALPRRRLDHLD